MEANIVILKLTTCFYCNRVAQRHSIEAAGTKQIKNEIMVNYKGAGELPTRSSLPM
jgi:hypothetical protein